MQFIGFRVPGQLSFTFDIAIHAGVEVSELDSDGSCGQTQASAAASAAELPLSPTWLGSQIKTSFFPELICS
jgi:hypothetical protein